MKKISERGLTSSLDSYQYIDVRPIAGAIGAEVLSIDLSKELDDDVIAEIRRAFLEHLVIFFREQRLTPAEFDRFVRRFGTLDPHHVLRGMDRHPNVLEIIRTETDRYIFAPGWHADVTTAAVAAATTNLLRSVEVRSKMSARGRALVDGNGVARVVEALRAKDSHSA